MYESEQRRQAKVMNPNNKVSRKVMNPNKVARKSLRARQSQYNTLNANVLYADLQIIVDLKYYFNYSCLYILYLHDRDEEERRVPLRQQKKI